MRNIEPVGGVTGWLSVALFCVYLLAGCAVTPTQFETGKRVAPPSGCIELRKRGGEC